MQSQAKQYDSKCSYKCQIDEFGVNNQGKHRKNYCKYGKKRDLNEIKVDLQEIFIHAIIRWSHTISHLHYQTRPRTLIGQNLTQDQTKYLDVSHTLDLDQKPVRFERVTELNRSEIEDFGSLNQAIEQPAVLIREVIMDFEGGVQ